MRCGFALKGTISPYAAVNRLDRLTSGCMIMALSPTRARQIGDEFLAGAVKKEVFDSP